MPSLLLSELIIFVYTCMLVLETSHLSSTPYPNIVFWLLDQKKDLLHCTVSLLHYVACIRIKKRKYTMEQQILVCKCCQDESSGVLALKNDTFTRIGDGLIGHPNMTSESHFCPLLLIIFGEILGYPHPPPRADIICACPLNTILFYERFSDSQSYVSHITCRRANADKVTIHHGM